MNAAAIPNLEAVRSGPLGAELSPREAEALSSLVAGQAFAAGDVVALEGTVDDRLVVIVSGALDVVRHRGTPHETVLATLRPGDLAHELGFLDGAPHFATLVAAAGTQVLLLQRGRLESLIESEPRVLYAVMRAILRTTHALQTRLSLQASELMNYVAKQHGRY